MADGNQERFEGHLVTGTQTTLSGTVKGHTRDFGLFEKLYVVVEVEVDSVKHGPPGVTRAHTMKALRVAELDPFMAQDILSEAEEAERQRAERARVERENRERAEAGETLPFDEDGEEAAFEGDGPVLEEAQAALESGNPSPEDDSER